MDSADSNKAKFLSWVNLKNALLYDLKEYIVPTGSDQTTTANTAQNVTVLVSSSLTASTSYYFIGRIRISCTGTGGVKLAVTAPTGALVSFSIFGITGGTGAQVSFVQTSGTLSSAFQTANGTSAVLVFGRINIGATAGAIQFQFASGTSGQTSTIHIEESFIELTKK